MLSYEHGASSTPLLGETIGENLDRAVREHGDRDALVVRHQEVRWSYAELGARVDRVARALIAAGLQPGDRLGIWAPNCVEWVLIQYASAKAGVVLVNINPAYRDLRARVRRSSSPGCGCSSPPRRSRSSDYRAEIDEVGPGCPALERVVFIGTADWDRLVAEGDADVATCPADLAVRRPDQHPVHERDHGLPEGRHALAPQHPQQRLLRRRGMRLHGARPGLHPGARSTTASAWSWATSAARRTARAW